MNPGRNTRARRAWKVAKWLLGVIAVLIAINWAGTWLLASSNQKTIDMFQEKVGARSLRELAGSRDESELVAGNGWYFYLAAVACIDTETSEAFSRSEDDEDRRPTEEQKTARESQLDRAHPLIADAVKAPRHQAVLHYDDPFDMRLPQLLPALRLTRLAASSARDHLAASRSDRAEKRLLDALAVSEGLLQMPTLLSRVMRLSAHDAVLNVLGPNLHAFSTGSLRSLNDHLASIDLVEATRKALAGEVFFGLHAWKRVGESREVTDGVSPPALQLWGYASLLLELDKRIYLNRMIPLALDPTPENARRASAHTPPFFAPLSRMAIPSMEHLMKHDLEHRQRMLAMREALRLEIARRKDGVLPAPRPEVEGVKIHVEETDEAIILSAPAFPSDRKPFTIVLPR
jgi:hypothetical protein